MYCYRCKGFPRDVQRTNSITDLSATFHHQCDGAWDIATVSEEAVRAGIDIELRFFRPNWFEYKRPTMRDLLERLAT
jgi:hypothetical protein